MCHGRGLLDGIVLQNTPIETPRGNRATKEQKPCVGLAKLDGDTRNNSISSHKQEQKKKIFNQINDDHQPDVGLCPPVVVSSYEEIVVGGI